MRVGNKKDNSQDIRFDSRHLNSRPNILPSRFAEDDSSIFHCFSKRLNLWNRNNDYEAENDWRGKEMNLNHYCCGSTHSVGAVCPGNCPVHHPGDARLLASLCQHLAYSLTCCHTSCGSQLLLQCPLFGWTGQHRDRRTAGEHLCRHVVLSARKLQSEKKCNRKESTTWGEGDLI